VLTLHIGLPKTGSTYLQHRIFRRVPDLRFIHRSVGPQEEKLCAALRKYVGASGLKAALMRRALTAAAASRLQSMDEAAPPGGIILSDETLSVTSGGFWRGKGPEPERVAERLHTLVAPLPPQFGPVKVLIGLRSQDTWLASRYADSARRLKDFSQKDFDARMMRIAGASHLSGPLAWLDHARVCKAFTTAFGADFVVLFRHERLEQRPGRVLKELGHKLGGLDLAAVHRRLKRRNPDVQRNMQSVSETSWTMQGLDTPLELREPVAAALRARFAASNEQLAALGVLLEGGPAPQRRRKRRNREKVKEAV
jgi:hypothetical protein